MALLAGLPKRRPYPSGRYAHTNPLRREAGLRLLTNDLPDPLRWRIVSAWRRPGFPSDKPVPLGLQETQRHHLDETGLAKFAPSTLGWFSFTQLEIARRLVEAPKESMHPATRNTLLIGQSVYLRHLYSALARKIGEAAALAEFARFIEAIN